MGIITEILSDSGFANLGFYAQGFLYFTFGICSFVAAPTVHALGDKWSLILGSLTYAIYTASQILPVLRSENPDNKTLAGMYNFMYGLILFTAALNGWGASILWVA